MELFRYSTRGYEPGRCFFIRVVWGLVDGCFMSSWLPGSLIRRVVLRLFGARIGKGVVIKPRVKIKFPWRLSIGDHSWIGENVWIDNLGDVAIGSNSCVSQGAYLCTGNHRWDSDTFDLVIQGIQIGNSVWIGACSSVAPGTVIQEGVVLKIGSSCNGVLVSWSIYGGVPAQFLRKREG